MWGEVIDHPDIREMCEVIASRLDLSGSMNVQLRLTPKGPRVFEINPRISSTAVMRHYLGFSDVVWSLAEIEGKRIEFPKISTGQQIVRTHDARRLELMYERA